MYSGRTMRESDIDLTPLSRPEFDFSYKNECICSPLSHQSTALLRARQGNFWLLFLLVGREARFDLTYTVGRVFCCFRPGIRSRRAPTYPPSDLAAACAWMV